MADALVVGSKVKDAIKAEGMNTAGDVVEGLSAVVADLVKKAVSRAKAKTLII